MPLTTLPADTATAKILEAIAEALALLKQSTENGSVLPRDEWRKKFEEHRLEMARSVWDQMRKTDSRECRNCHDFSFMDTAQQQKFQHDLLNSSDRTCIDCHKGIAHTLPDAAFEAWKTMEAELKAEAGADSS